jgi:hypothetical protein
VADPAAAARDGATRTSRAGAGVVDDDRALAHADIPRYLLSRRLLRPSSIVNDRLEVVEVSRRNRAFRVTTDGGPCYFLKQGTGPDRSTTVAHEAMVYRMFGSSADAEGLRHYLPDHIAFDAERGLLVLELLRSSEDLASYHRRTGRFSISLARRLGTALSTLHRQGTAATGQAAFGPFSGRRPWALYLDTPSLATVQDLSAANLRLIGIVQSSAEFRERLRLLRRGWRSDTLIHHDIKWQNCLVQPRSGSSRVTELKLVDWEFADWGDACWDAGAVLGNYLGSWVMSVPISGNDPPGHYLELAAHPLSAMQPAIAAYWRAYERGMALDAESSREWLDRAVAYAAVRLLQTCHEQMRESTRLSGNVVAMLQLSLNILRRPREAAVHLLGLSFSQG